MTNEGLTLQQVAQRAVDRNGGAAGRALDRAAKKAGLTLSYTTVDKLLAGTYRSRPKQATLDALATLAGLPKETVYRAADRPLPLASLAEQLPPEADTLTPAQRDAVLSVIRQFAVANAAARHVSKSTPREVPEKPTAYQRGLQYVSLSAVDDSVEDLVAAHEEEGSISGEQEQPTEP